jgi:hypothetical protein
MDHVRGIAVGAFIAAVFGGLIGYAIAVLGEKLRWPTR